MCFFICFEMAFDIDGINFKIKKNNFINIFIYLSRTENDPKKNMPGAKILINFQYNCLAH